MEFLKLLGVSMQKPNSSESIRLKNMEMIGYVFEKITTLMSPPLKEIIDYLLKQTK
jgi:hypothetical protein